MPKCSVKILTPGLNDIEKIYKRHLSYSKTTESQMSSF